MKNYQIEIDKYLVLKYLGYKDKVPKDILDEVGECVDESYGFIKPAICFDQLKFKFKDGILLPDESIIKVQYIVEVLKRSDYIVMAVMTLGKEIEDKISTFFARNDYMKGMIYDVIGNVGLEYMGKRFWQELAEVAKKDGIGITQSLNPGTGGWKDIKDQSIIFNNLNTSLIGVELTDAFMMKPMKSLSMVYGIGKAVKTSLVDHDCAECPLIDCPYRKEVAKCIN
ncbi:MAG: hypothetical protein M1542_03870 [Thermotogae bacterium]|nr:hypothetical protein [Thermotogota bacterium]